ncbi:molybdate ABC transporter substrate-binding protein [Oceanicella actignis]|uniref:Molybdate transport system substrate-binding protein n=1 Tax=Oceanicella actignis TaxID=1189325 RepID=A0A1M7SI82_9RHOB|nr:molybdate ABC transporter substrate-binding protein [Oceanicella actignis]SET18068.1 molybdate transport system substrate-binding protein [Oceanicella actignis]SHN58159.1 molybdate transport system substrate-binding protein [Oceanicella actignis]
MLRRRLRIALVALLAAMAAASAPGARARQADPEALVAAASDLQFAFPELAAAFAAEGRGRVRAVFGSTGNFARQLRQGAPYELFMAADESFVRALARDGVLPDEGAPYAEGRLALLVRRGGPLAADGALEELAAALREGRVRRFAIANPEHAPYGMRARDALRAAGLWEALQPVLVMGENVAQAAQFVASGAAQGGVAALSLAMSPRIARQVDHAPIPPHMHPPLIQRMALTRRAGPAARAFFAFVRSERGRRILAAHGFAPPAD